MRWLARIDRLPCRCRCRRRTGRARRWLWRRSPGHIGRSMTGVARVWGRRRPASDVPWPRRLSTASPAATASAASSGPSHARPVGQRCWCWPARQRAAALYRNPGRQHPPGTGPSELEDRHLPAQRTSEGLSVLRSVGGDDGGEVVVAGSDRSVQGPHDAGGVVVGALLEVGLAVSCESDPAGWLPGAKVRGCQVEVAVGVEAEAPGVVDGAEDEVLYEFDRGR